MKYVQGYGTTISSDHPDDTDTSITVLAGTCLLVLDGYRSAMVMLETEDEVKQVLTVLDCPPADVRSRSVELASYYWLTVACDCRTAPLINGILVSVGARPYHPMDPGDTLSVFVKGTDIPRLRKAIAWRDDKASGTLVITTKRIET